MIDKEDIEKKINELIEKLNYHTSLYDAGNPEISDREWDAMYFELLELENVTGDTHKYSPTQNIIFKSVSELQKAEHDHPMLSLAKTKSIDELKSFIGNKETIGMLKMDGLTCSLRYEDGYLVRAETRGNGLVGEDITHNILTVRGVPRRIPTSDKVVTIDGEIICTDKDFKPFANEYKNSRNFASGSIRLLDSNECAKRNLTFIAWDILYGLTSNSLWNELQILGDIGFIPVPNFIIEENVEKDIENLKELANSKGYPIDGLVFKYNDNEYFDSCGNTGHHFKGGIAYKFYDEEYETTLLDVEWTMGRTGALTPVGILSPIEINGAEISRVNLHNVSIMEELGLEYKSSKVMIYRANEIIPQVSSVLPYEGALASPIYIPEVCPICGGETFIKRENNSQILMCGNDACEGKLINHLEHYTDMKKGMAIKGISKATLEKLIDWGWMNSLIDFYSLKDFRNQWMQKEGFGEKSVEKILEAIENSKNCKLEQFICAIGIPLIGMTNSKEICKHIKTFEELVELCENDFAFEKWPTFGPEKAYSLRKFDFTEAKEISSLLNFQIETKENKQNLQNMVFCITGKLNLYKNRDELVSIIELNGGKVSGSVSKNTTYLINNDTESSSAKNKKAKDLNVEIINEQFFATLLD